MKTYVGVCGFKKKYYTGKIRCVEIQRTFYNIPQEKTVRKWREEAPSDFIFNIKVFQGLTHVASSPTWRRYTKKLSAKEKGLVGNLKVNELTKTWIDTYAEFSRILDARVLVVQTPAKFAPTQENVNYAEKFFEYFVDVIDKYGSNAWIGWEPRGKWLEKPQLIEKIVGNVDRVIHIVDPLIHEPVVVKSVAYFRLHGKPYLNYKYLYEKEDLETILDKVKTLCKRADAIYLMFNNVYMDKNAEELIEMIG